MVIGATGTIGREVAGRLGDRHQVIRSSRQTEPPVDLEDRRALPAFFDAVGDVDAVVCCAAHASLTAIDSDCFVSSLEPKLLGQVEIVRTAAARLRAGGSVTLTGGSIPEDLLHAAGGALVNAGLEAFVRRAAPEMPRSTRLNIVRPGWVRETLQALGMDPSGGTPAAKVAQAYVASVEGDMSGEVLIP